MPYLFLHFRENRRRTANRSISASPRRLSGRASTAARRCSGGYRGRLGTRDHAGIRTDDGFVILSTDLSLSYHIRGDRGGENLWQTLSRRGSAAFPNGRPPTL